MRVRSSEAIEAVRDRFKRAPVTAGRLVRIIERSFPDAVWAKGIEQWAWAARGAVQPGGPRPVVDYPTALQMLLLSEDINRLAAVAERALGRDEDDLDTLERVRAIAEGLRISGRRGVSGAGKTDLPFGVVPALVRSGSGDREALAHAATYECEMLAVSSKEPVTALDVAYMRYVVSANERPERSSLADLSRASAGRAILDSLPDTVRNARVNLIPVGATPSLVDVLGEALDDPASALGVNYPAVKRVMGSFESAKASTSTDYFAPLLRSEGELLPEDRAAVQTVMTAWSEGQLGRGRRPFRGRGETTRARVASLLDSDEFLRLPVDEREGVRKTVDSLAKHGVDEVSFVDLSVIEEALVAIAKDVATSPHLKSGLKSLLRISAEVADRYEATSPFALSDAEGPSMSTFVHALLNSDTSPAVQRIFNRVVGLWSGPKRQSGRAFLQDQLDRLGASAFTKARVAPESRVEYATLPFLDRAATLAPAPAEWTLATFLARELVPHSPPRGAPEARHIGEVRARILTAVARAEMPIETAKACDRPLQALAESGTSVVVPADLRALIGAYLHETLRENPGRRVVARTTALAMQDGFSLATSGALRKPNHEAEMLDFVLFVLDCADKEAGQSTKLKQDNEVVQAIVKTGPEWARRPLDGGNLDQVLRAGGVAGDADISRHVGMRCREMGVAEVWVETLTLRHNRSTGRDSTLGRSTGLTNPGPGDR